MLKEIIDQFYRDSFEERDRFYFYISDAGKCPRALYFQFKKVPRKQPNPRILRVFDEGDYIHMRLMSVLFSLGVAKAVEVSIPPRELIHGRADAIVVFDNTPYVLEIKSTSDFNFRKLKKPQPYHLKQLQLYMHYFKIAKGILLYENKDNQRLKEFLIEYDPNIVEKLLKDFELLREQIKKDVIPAIPESIESWRCRYCDYRRECSRVEKSKLKIL